MLKRLVTFLLGHLRIVVSGGEIERFLNLALAEGLYLWGIRRMPDRMEASLTIRSFFVLRRVARGSRCRVRILSRQGLPFLVGRLRRRPVLIVGALVCGGFLFWATGHIWVVNVKVTGPQHLDPRAVSAVAAEAGLKPGVWSAGVDAKLVEQHIQKRVGEVAWAVIRVQGTRAVIEVVEKAAHRAPPGSTAPCVNLVARKDGVVEQVIPFQGEPMVKKGDIVRAGDLLVECSFRYWAGGRPAVYPGTPVPPRETHARTVMAQALVRARVAYQQYREVLLFQEVPVPTGERATRWVIVWRDRSIIVRGRGEIPFAQHQEHRRTYTLPTWRNWRPPVEVVIVNLEEVKLRREQVPLSRLLEQATEQMTARLRWLLGPSDRLLAPVQAEVVERGADFVGIRVTAETLEEIAAPREGAPILLSSPADAPGTSPTRP